MIKIILTKGVPGSGKSTWAKQEIAKDPQNWLRINNDDLRSMCNNSNWSSSYEKMIGEFRRLMITEGLRKNKNIIIDNVNSNEKHFKDACMIAKNSGKDVEVFEKIFYLPVEELIERDAKREGKAKVGEKIVRKFFKDLGGKEFAFYNPKKEVFLGKSLNTVQKPFDTKTSKPIVIVADIDGSLSLFNKPGEEEMHPGAHWRNPYDASNASKDTLNIPLAETIKAHYLQGRQVIYLSGRDSKYRDQTVQFIEQHMQIDGKIIPYELFMRQTKDSRPDTVIKKEIYENYILPIYEVLVHFDDRNSVVNSLREELNLPVFQVAPGNF